MNLYPRAHKWQLVNPELARNTEFGLGEYRFPSEEFVRRLHHLSPNQIPSGISGLRLSAKDHILFLVASTTDRYFDIIADFIAAGLEDPVFEEICTLEMSNRWSEEAARQILRARTSKLSPDRVDILTWEVGFSPYSKEKDIFRAETMQNVFFDQMYRTRRGFQPAPYRCVRVASEDSSSFLLTLQNPRAYLAYERRLADDLFDAFKTPVLQLCSYQLSDLHRADKERAVSLRESVIALLDSHNKAIAYTKEDRLITGPDAARFALSHITMEGARLKTWLRYVYVRLKHQAL